MALQGTLETFSLPDVLTLLSSTNKTGCLRLRGDRGVGAVWVAEGGIVASEADGVHAGGSATDVLFELLRYAEGEFVFDEGHLAENSGSPTGVAEVLAEAQSQLEEWTDLEVIVPSGQHFVSLASQVAAEVTISPEHWTAIAVVGSGHSVSGLGEDLSLGEVPVARLLKDLVAQGLVEIGDPRDEPEPAFQPEPVFEVEPTFEPEPSIEADQEFEVDQAFESDTFAEEEADDGYEVDVEPFDPGALDIDEPEYETAYDEEPEASFRAASEPPAPADAAEIARQIANLSPKAARAVAAAAKATTPEERDAALAEVEAADEAINRDLLLKFLGSQN